MTTRRTVLAGLAATMAAPPLRAAPRRQPRAIAMWDFSWLERRWPGGGYEDWERALDELRERGYDAVRIDAYPHLVAAGPTRDWTLKGWPDRPWGAQGRVTVRIMPALTGFVAAAHRRGIKVALSSWFRQDDTNARMRLASPEKFAAAWIATIGEIERAGLLDALLFVDLCNEWPADTWAPFVDPPQKWGDWPSLVARRWMDGALAMVRAAYPQLPLCFSSERADVQAYLRTDVAALDLIEQHIWMSDQADRAFMQALGAASATLPSKDAFDQLAAFGASTYRAREDYWNGLLTGKIAQLADVSRRLGKPLATTECWAVVNAVDWPNMDWGWIKDCCAVGVQAAAASGRWLAIATSNFCGPQSVTMWRDVEWHRRQTSLIHAAAIQPDLWTTRLYGRL